MKDKGEMIKRKRIKWNEKTVKARVLAEEYLKQNGIATTLRGLFYIMVSRGELPNTVNAYKRLSSNTAKARYKGVFPASLIRDITRAKEDLEPHEFYPKEPLGEDDLKKEIDKIVNEHAKVNVNPWADQPEEVIVLIEKEAQFALVTKFITEGIDHGVRQVVFSRGYNSATDMIRIANLIKFINANDKHVALLIITDFDPSGEDIARDYSTRLLLIDGSLNFSAEKIAVTKDQITKFGLPAVPKSAEVKKLRRDPRFTTFENKHGLMRVELDALVALHSDEFKKILLEAIIQHFDKKIYLEKTVQREKEIKRKANEYKNESIENLHKLVESGELVG